MAEQAEVERLICPNCGGRMSPYSTAKRTPWSCPDCRSESKPSLKEPPTMTAEPKIESAEEFASRYLYSEGDAGRLDDLIRARDAQVRRQALEEAAQWADDNGATYEIHSTEMPYICIGQGEGGDAIRAIAQQDQP